MSICRPRIITASLLRKFNEVISEALFQSARTRAHVKTSSWMIHTVPSRANGSDTSSVTIGNITVPSAPEGSGRRDLVPTLDSNFLEETMPPCHLSHLRWMLQKDLVLKQDFLLLGTPELARERRHLMMLYAALVGREIQYISLTKDTSEADLKQRKEVTNGRAIYIDQAPVQAAKYGRLLILDGLEKAERNVLPTLNNLLENREMNLDDGSMLVSHDVYDAYTADTHGDTISSHSGLNIHRVHPDFRIAAVVSLIPGESVTLDPPLRSRFQGRYAPSVDIRNVVTTVSAQSKGLLDSKTFRALIETVGQVPSDVPLQSIHDAVRYFETYQDNMEEKSALDAHGINSNGDMIGATSVRSPFNHNLNMYKNVPEFVETKTTENIRDLIIAAFQNGSRAVACVGPKGCYKSALAKETARVYGAKVELFSLYTDLTSRDLLMVRATDMDSGDTVWRETPLTKAMRCGNWLILDGVDKLRADVLSSIAIMIEQGWIDLPNGDRMYVHEKFRCIAIAHLPEQKSWITPEIKSMFHWIEATPLPNDELSDVLKTLYPLLNDSDLSMILHLKDLLDGAVFGGAVDSMSGKESLVLTLRKMKHICRRVQQGLNGDLSKIIHNTLMTDFMPDAEKNVVEKCLGRCGISKKQGDKSAFEVTLDKELLSRCRRHALNPLLVPNPKFEENPGQAQVMNDILEAHSAGEKALLISGYQGVGKNRVVDYLLSLLNCEREYLQLHRDTTVQSLMSSPSVENGRIVHHDSPLVRAAKFGRVLVLDEADKAPLEVVALLKGLIEDGQLALPDGRTLCEGKGSDTETVQIHPDFRIWTLTNPARFPFHGNDLAREMSDIFSCHHVKVMDIESHRRILRSYGKNVSSDTIEKIIKVWDELRKAHEDGRILYPFSVRESVNVIKHLNSYSKDGIESALENVISFDRLDITLSNQLKQIFDDHGISVFTGNHFNSNTHHAQGGISTPRTRVSSPKHGKVDPDNLPHVGGNTWAGGTGGSDTAGLGGRGGPYRLDAGHPVHQISDQMKAEVSEEVQKKSRKMAEDALKKKLHELNMGSRDWSRYSNVRKSVDLEIHQLRSHLKDLNRRNEDRVWIKRQTSGELDDSRIVDAILGEKDVFKRRGISEDSKNKIPLTSDAVAIKFIVDISASMYRFNGYDGRLDRLLEASVMIMESLREDTRFKLSIIGHNGSSAKIPLFNPEMSLDEKTQLKVLEQMVAHTQYTYAGDNTVEAIRLAVKEAKKGDLILIISDANLERYQITPDDLDDLQSSDVHAHLILIGSFGDEARKLSESIPNERAQVCLKSSDLPLIIKNIVTNALRQ